MKTLGLIGGMSWESTVSYYKMINESVKDALGGLHSAKILLYSVDFEEIERYQHQGDWDKCAKILGDIALKLQNAGADMIVICTNTMHKLVPQIEKNIHIPIHHIAQATADVIVESGLHTVGLLGTKYTMVEDFYKKRIHDNGIAVIIPDEEHIQTVNAIIYDELCLGKIETTSKKKYLEIIESLIQKGAQGIILGCTEIGLLIQQKDVRVPIFDSTQIHAQSAAHKSIASMKKPR